MPFLVIAGVVISYVILYFIIKAAVRDGIVEAHKINDAGVERTEIAQKTCPNCGKTHDIDYPKCPYCKHIY